MALLLQCGKTFAVQAITWRSMADETKSAGAAMPTLETGSIGLW
jgi:hypothetical protein